MKIESKNDFMTIHDDRTMLLESYVRFRQMYINMLSLKNWGDACPSVVMRTLEDMRELLTLTFGYLGNSAVNEYMVQQRELHFRLNKAAEDIEKEAARRYMDEHPEGKGGIL